MSETEQTEPVAPQEQPQEPDEPGPNVEPTPEPGEPSEPDIPLEEPPPEPETQAVMEEIGKKLDTLTKSVATRVTTILGDEAVNFEVCDLCSYWNTPGWRRSGPLPQDLTAELLHLLNMRAPSDLKEDPHSKVCPTCDGEGAVDTRSKVPGQTSLPCVECEGMGWLPTDDARRRGRLQLANGPTAQALGVTAADAQMQPGPVEVPPEVQALRDAGYVVVPPMPATV